MSSQIIHERLASAIDQWVNKFPKGEQKSATLMALRLVQEEYRWLEQPHLDAVAEYLKLPKIDVYEVASFYSMYQHQPVGKHLVKVCTSLSCCLNGAYGVVEYLEGKLNIQCGQTTKDGRITLQETECLAACAGAPAICVDDKFYHENVTAQTIEKMIRPLIEEGA
ncbi:MAG: NAD(P)H-dependent oxidoreductase subunit E [Gammaproteobacteria bacterium]|jgi:NADH-quinone oxidoreductase subunit E|nr:NAD(P)H-dependent oxidoreductase subunit E [Gammaproteobacteria bacterium]